jgi:lipopolysaccharide/colanic/teichoic acid biosynthesis glycosyltransferase
LSTGLGTSGGVQASEPQGAARRQQGGASTGALRLTVDAAAKRVLDVLVSGVLLLALLPVLVAIAVLVRLDSPGPSFFRCDRVGYRGRPLRMLKFRKMLDDASGTPLTVSDDERFTRLGRWLTKYKLDELPQLWHVLRGEMSLVGPRPEGEDFVQRYPHEYYDHILTVRPGIVGLSQLAFAAENRILDPQDPVAQYVDQILPQKVSLDRMYAARRTLWLDARISVWAVATVVLRLPVAVNRQSAEMNLRRR